MHGRRRVRKGRRKSEVRNRKSEVGSKKSEVGNLQQVYVIEASLTGRFFPGLPAGVKSGAKLFLADINHRDHLVEVLASDKTYQS